MNLFSKEKEEGLDPWIDVTYGAFTYKGDWRLIRLVMKEIEDSVVPVMMKGNEEAAKLGLVPIQNNVKHGEDVERGYN